MEYEGNDGSFATSCIAWQVLAVMVRTGGTKEYNWSEHFPENNTSVVCDSPKV